MNEEPSMSIFSKLFCLVFTVFQVWAICIGSIDPWIHRVAFLGFIFPLCILDISRGSRRQYIIAMIFALLLMASIGYLLVNGERFVTRWPMVSPLYLTDMVIAVFIMALTLWLTWKNFGRILVIIVFVFILYSFLGPILPGLLYHQGMSLGSFIDQNVYTTTGLLGLPLGVATTYVFAFVTFGCILHKGGGGEFFFNLANAVAGRTIGGPAKVAVVSSALYGMISGSAVSDAATTGSFTIPMMKRMGFSSTFAAAVEAVASTGGGILPPVMGSVAFLMAEFTNIPYMKIAMASTIPALLYYGGLYWQIHYHSIRLGFTSIDSNDNTQRLGYVLKHNWQYLVPLIVLVWLLVIDLQPALAAIIASILAVASSWVKKETRMGWREILEAIVTACHRVASVGCVCAVAGFVIGGVVFTGLSGKMLSLILTISEGNLFLALLVTAVATIIFGMGIPVVPAYAITSVLAAPALQELGLSVMAAHLFVLYYANMSAITPPIAVAAYVTAGIADADPTKVGFLSMRLGFVTFIVPFIFVYEPALNLEGSWVTIMLAIPTAALGIWAIARGVEGWHAFNNHFGMLERATLIAGGLLLFYPGIITDLIGIAVVIITEIRVRSYTVHEAGF